MKLSDEADRLAGTWKGESHPDWDDLRDWIDQETAGDLDCQQIDILTDMAALRIKARAFAKATQP